MDNVLKRGVVDGVCLCFLGRFQDREELFAYEINWQVVETHNIIQAKMRPWIVKKIIEYLGEEEKTLTEFILTKLGQRALPQVRMCACLYVYAMSHVFLEGTPWCGADVHTTYCCCCCCRVSSAFASEHSAPASLFIL